MSLNRRKSERHYTMGLISSLWDGKSSYLGVVDDLSSTGICISQVPKSFDDKSEFCFTIVHGPFDDFKLTLRPSWKAKTKTDMYQSIGFQVVGPTQSWKRFITETLDTMMYNDN